MNTPKNAETYSRTMKTLQVLALSVAAAAIIIAVMSSFDIPEKAHVDMIETPEIEVYRDDYRSAQERETLGYEIERDKDGNAIL